MFRLFCLLLTIGSISALAQEPVPSTPSADTYTQGSEECAPLTTAEWWLVGEDRLVELLDLKQQCRMAVSTEDMAFWSLLQLVASAASVLLLVATVHYTRIAAAAARATQSIAVNTLREAELATQAAQAGASASEKMIRQNRAWMCLHDDTSLVPTYGGEQGRELQEMQVIFRIWNNGGSPALDVRYECSPHWSGPELDREKVLAKMRSNGPSTLGGGQRAFVEFRFNREGAVDKALSFPTYVYVCCEYRTIYGEVYLFEETIVLRLKETEKRKPRIFDADFVAAHGQNGYTFLRQEQPV